MFLLTTTTPTASIDCSFKVTEIVTIFALFFGPLVAVWITERARKNDETKKRKIHIFRTLMATRSSALSANHIEALNLVEIEFKSNVRKEKEVIRAWRLYIAHLNTDSTLASQIWNQKTKDLLGELLFQLSNCLGYDHDKAQIQQGAYYPQAYFDAEIENKVIRAQLIKVLHGQQHLQMKVDITNPNGQAQQSTPPPRSIPNQ